MTLSSRIGIAIAVVVFAIAQFGCVSVRGGGAAATPTTKPTDQVCLTRGEVAKIQAFKVRCRSKVKALRVKASHKQARATKVHKAKLAACKVRLTGCHKQATTKHACPSCLSSVAVAGLVAGLAGLAAGIAAGVLGTLAIRGANP